MLFDAILQLVPPIEALTEELAGELVNQSTAEVDTDRQNSFLPRKRVKKAAPAKEGRLFWLQRKIEWWDERFAHFLRPVAESSSSATDLSLSGGRQQNEVFPRIRFESGLSAEERHAFRLALEVMRFLLITESAEVERRLARTHDEQESIELDPFSVVKHSDARQIQAQREDLLTIRHFYLAIAQSVNAHLRLGTFTNANH